MLKVVEEKFGLSPDKLMILLTAGSRAYGLANEHSDLDIRGIFFEDVSTVIGFDKNDYKQFQGDELDIALNSSLKHIKLLSNQNPDTLITLGISEDLILYKDPLYNILTDNLDKLLSKKVYKTFKGCALGEYKCRQKYSDSGSYRKANKSATTIIRLLMTAEEILNERIIRAQRPKEQLATLKDLRYDSSRAFDPLFKEWVDKLDLAYLKSKILDEPDYHWLSTECGEMLLNRILRR